MTEACVQECRRCELVLGGNKPCWCLVLLSGCGSMNVTGTVGAPTVTISANPSSIPAGASSTLTVISSYATQVTVTGSDGTT